jgi:hypothetical protein
MAKQIKYPKKALFVAFTATVLVAVLFLLVHVRNRGGLNGGEQTGIINYGPPTEEEKRAGDIRKQEIDTEQKQNDENTSTGKKTVSVIITDAAQYSDKIEVRSFIPNYLQDGTCIITFKKDTQTLTKTTRAYRDISTTICTTPVIKRSEFPVSGDWQVSVSYQSQDAEGVSDLQTITIE